MPGSEQSDLGTLVSVDDQPFRAGIMNQHMLDLHFPER